MARCMLHQKESPKKLWAWFSFKPSLIFLKIFGCLCYLHTPQVKHDKLDKRVEPGVFVGYHIVCKAYRIFLPQIGNFLINIANNLPIRGTRLLSDIYQRRNIAVCNIVVCELANFEEAIMEKKGLGAM
ncbi:hypothetical protein CR513_61278, partial [Mucuna pruriens]